MQDVERPYSIYADCDSAAPPAEVFNLEEQKHRLEAADSNYVSIVRNVLDDVPSFLPFFAEIYNISADIKDYVLVPVTIFLADIPNKKGHCFPLAELTSADPYLGCLKYKTWEKQPTFVNHCFPAGTMITTRKGKKDIKNIKVGDTVLTHDRQFKKVSHVFKNGVKSVSEIKCSGLLDSVKVTKNHPMWVIDARQIHEGTYFQNSKGMCKLKSKWEKTWSELEPHFRPVSDIYEGDYLCIPVNMGGDIAVDKDLAFLTGAHMAEGCYEWYKGKPVAVQLTLGRSETAFREKIYKCCENLGYEYNTYYHKKNNTALIRISNKDFARLMLELTGNLAHKKRMKSKLRKWNKESMQHFLGAYITGDGCISSWNKTGTTLKMRCRTTSKDLAEDIQHALGFVGVCANIENDQKKEKKMEYFCPRYKKFRTAIAKMSYCVTSMDFEAYSLNDFILNKKKMTNRNNLDKSWRKIMLKDKYFIVPVKEIRHDVSKEEVFNFEVAGVHTYVANGVAVHNCNKDHTKAKGIILNSSMYPAKTLAGDLWKVVLLQAFDRLTYPDLGKSILSGETTAYSMGAHCKGLKCSICSSDVPESRCGHISQDLLRGRPFEFEHFNGKLSYIEAVNIKGFECSALQPELNKGNPGNNPANIVSWHKQEQVMTFY